MGYLDPIGRGRWGVGSRHRHARTLAKTIGYRILMLAITVLVALLVTDDIASAVNIGIAANAIKTLTYYGYERLWTRINWGRAAH